MDYTVFDSEFKVREFHWWFTGRKLLFSRFIKRMALNREAAIIDIGISTGTNLQLLQSMGFINFTGIDCNEDALNFCRQKGFLSVRQGDACSLPLENESVDFVMATDILEHIENDSLALQEIYRILKPGGMGLITVPTFMLLWGLQDEISHHKRRYLLPPLIEMISKTGFAVQKAFYFNYVLFFPILFARRIIKFLKIKLGSENNVNNWWLNKILTVLFKIDILIASKIRVPFGASAFLLIRK